MPLYTYKAKNEMGRVISGEIKISDHNELAVLLKQKGFTPIEVQEKNFLTDISQISIFKKKISVKDLAVFCRQFAIVLEAGVPIATAMDVLRDQTSNPTLKSVLSDVYENIQKGISLSDSLGQHVDVFPEILINMVEAGEVSGQLDLVFSRLAESFEKDFKLRQKIKSTLTYPVILLVVAAIVIGVLMTFVVPTFASVLTGMNQKLPLYTEILVAVSSVFKNFWYVFLILIVLLIIGASYFAKTPSGKRFFGKLLITIPVISGVTRTIICARFTRNLGTLIGSGVLLIQAMEIVKKVIGNYVIAEKMDVVIDEIRKGKGLTQPLANMGYFPSMLVSMVRIGEESGSIDFSLDKSADFYDQEVETVLDQLTTLMEPLITIIMGVVVAFIILSIIIPMFTVYQGLSAQ
ncbi:MAG TPA: type II secretion system F family protein [Clostridia bacterium]